MSKLTSLTLGILFIIIGIALFLDKLAVWQLEWYTVYPVLLIALAVLAGYSTFKGNTSSVFWAVTLGILGVAFALRNYALIPYYHTEELWPLFVLAPGIGFLSLYIVRPTDWGVLIPGSLLTFFGLITLLRTLGYSWYVIHSVQTYWPLILIVIGLGLLYSSMSRRK
jgi:hypothetical protein